MSDYPMLISNKLHSFRNFALQNYKKLLFLTSRKPFLIFGSTDATRQILRRRFGDVVFLT